MLNHYLINTTVDSARKFSESPVVYRLVDEAHDSTNCKTILEGQKREGINIVQFRYFG